MFRRDFRMLRPDCPEFGRWPSENARAKGVACCSGYIKLLTSMGVAMDEAQALFQETASRFDEMINAHNPLIQSRMMCA